MWSWTITASLWLLWQRTRSRSKILKVISVDGLLQSTAEILLNQTKSDWHGSKKQKCLELRQLPDTSGKYETLPHHTIDRPISLSHWKLAGYLLCSVIGNTAGNQRTVLRSLHGWSKLANYHDTPTPLAASCDSYPELSSGDDTVCYWLKQKLRMARLTRNLYE